MAAAESTRDWTPPGKGERWSEEVGRAMLEAFRESGEGQSAFARRHGLNSQRIYYWQQRLSSSTSTAARQQRGPGPVTFAPVRVVDSANGAGAAGVALEVVVGTAMVRVPPGFDEAHLRRVLATLGGVAC